MQIGQENTHYTDEEIRKRLGDWNDLPPKLRPATADDFWCDFLIRGFKKEQARQPYVAREDWLKDFTCIKPSDPKDSMMLTACRVFIRPDLSGMMVALDYKHGHYTPHFYKFAFCDHTRHTTQNLGRCYNAHTCLDCGHVSRVDSSD